MVNHVKLIKKIFKFMTFHTKLSWLQNHWVFDKIDIFIKIYDGIRYLVLYNSSNICVVILVVIYSIKICDRIR